MRLALALIVFPAWGQAPPELLVPQQDAAGMTGEALPLEYLVQWAGDPGDWLVAPPELPGVAWGGLELTGVDVFQQDGMNTLRYRIAARSAEAGNFEVPPLNFHFQDGKTELARDDQGGYTLPGQIMKSPAVMLRVSEPFHLPSAPVLAGVVLLLLIGISAGVLLALRRRNRQAVSVGASLLEQLRQSMHEARGMRLDGDYYAYYKALSGVCERIAKHVEDGNVLLVRLQERTQGVGYRGLQVTDETMDADWREVERAMARYRENAS